MASWLNLPGDLVSTIGELLDSYADFFRLRAVCASWRHVLPNRPWLMLPFDDDDDRDTDRSFFSLVDKKIYKLDLPETRNKLFRGSFNGWLITQDVSSPALYLFNPLSRVYIDLPPLITFPNVIVYDPDTKDIPGYQLTENNFIGANGYLNKVVLTTPPTLGNNDDNGAGYLAVAIHGPYRLIAFCKRGDKKWTAPSAKRGYFDATFHENKLYAIRDIAIEVSDLNSSLNFVDIPLEFSPKLINEFGCHCQMKYLVSCDLGLLVVLRYYGKENEISKTKGFMVYRVEKNLQKCFRVESLGDYMLFVGLNTSFAIRSQSGGLKRNCIYYTEDKIDLHREDLRGGYDFGVYNMRDGKTSKLEGYQEGDLLLYWSYPIWVVPNVVSSI